MIKKINDLTNSESFLQIDFIKGFKYIDKAGEIINEFHTDNNPPKFSMNLNGLVMLEPTTELAEIKISSDIFWAHFIEPNSLEMISDVFNERCEKVLKILEIKQIKRFGWRNYFVHEFNTEQSREKTFKKFTLNEFLKLEQAFFTYTEKKIVYNIRIKKIAKKDKNKTPAILFDIDSFKIYDTPLEQSKIGAELVNIKSEIRSEKLLDAINAILSDN